MRVSRMCGGLAALLGLSLSLGLGLVLTSGGPAQAVARLADGGAHRSPHTLGLSRATVPASTLLCAKVAAKAGFSFNQTVGTSLGQEPLIIVAISVAMAESSCDPGATNHNSGGSQDRGLWQMNSVYHSEVSNACAFQIQCNADAAWNVSDHGTDWSPWSTFTNGAWKKYVSDARAAISGGFSFQLGSSAGGTCLAADRADHANGAPVWQWACDSGDHYQQWTVVSDVGALPILRNVGTGTCLDWGETKAGTVQPVVQWTCEASDGSQQFWFLGSGRMNTDGQAQALVRNNHAGTCLDADGTNHANGAPIRQWTCNVSDGFQMWN
ncbi:RICIN domain-containing protein [Catenulispora sp. NF23]|uniref:RICIN domain-containing protein n=1 Tax=Catenulispora pinistramenti TaxID=2705254 RepID=UPI001BA82BF1|nr:RICIN domain-containing protein [Catenulispora pinistramenti]MBS2539088.1 RICIN domain-containing protein [Catenulispora pinistramenti]